jgi:hypothetical protein
LAPRLDSTADGSTEEIDMSVLHRVTTAQAVEILKGFQLLDEGGNVLSSVVVHSGTGCVVTLQTRTPVWNAQNIVSNAEKATLWRFASNAGGLEDNLDIRFNDTTFTFRLKPVTEIPAAG